MAKKYRMNSLAGPFVPGTVVTEEQVEKAGGDLAFWLSHGGATELPADYVDPAAGDVLSDGGVNARIESRIREETIKRGRPLTDAEQSNLIGEVKADNARAIKARDAKGRPAPPVAAPKLAPPPAGTTPGGADKK